MQLNPQICDRARLSRDRRFDGLFFTGVHSTGIFCRPICPAPAPKSRNITYYPSAAAAMNAGLRPCLRCRPESSPGSPAWNGTSATVSRAMALIRQGALDNGGVEALAFRLGVGGRQLRRLFKTHIGAGPLSIAIAQKVLFAKKLIAETELPMAQIAFAAGFGSIRHFNAAFRKVYGKTPSALRVSEDRKQPAGAAYINCTLELPFRPPFDWPRMLAFYRNRAITGVEQVVEETYTRTIRLNHTKGIISVGGLASQNVLTLDVKLSHSSDLMAIVERVRRMFDLDANLLAIYDAFSGDPILEPMIRTHAGLRLPGAWDPFEISVRAVAGQQVTVKAARTILGRLAAKAGPECEVETHPGLTRFFPAAKELAGCHMQNAGMPRKRWETIQRLSKAVASGDMRLEVSESLGAFVRRITRLPGIGPWTANYIAMRALEEPDAFPADDLGIAKALQQGPGRPTKKQILERAESWRPWRGYAAIYLWHSRVHS